MLEVECLGGFEAVSHETGISRAYSLGFKLIDKIVGQEGIALDYPTFFNTKTLVSVVVDWVYLEPIRMAMNKLFSTGLSQPVDYSADSSQHVEYYDALSTLVIFHEISKSTHTFIKVYQLAKEWVAPQFNITSLLRIIDEEITHNSEWFIHPFSSHLREFMVEMKDQFQLELSQQPV